MFRSLANWTARLTSPSSTGLHLGPLDGLRGVAILMVVAAHGFYANPDGPRALAHVGALLGTGWMGVPMFFALSGFLIAHPFLQGRARDPQFWCPRGYAARRALKVFPPFLLTTLLLSIYYVARHGDWDYARLGAEWVTGIAHFKPQPKFFNNSFWSLWVEVAFYAVLPLLFWLLRGLRAAAAAAGVCALLCVVPVCSRLLFQPAQAGAEEQVIFDRLFVNRLDSFAWGVLFAALYARFREHPRWGALAGLGWLGIGVFLAAAALFAFVPLSPRAHAELGRLLPGAGAFLLLFTVCDPSSVLARLLTAPWLRLVGIVSFEWFLLHQPVLMQAREIAGGAGGSVAVYAAITVVPLAVTFAASLALYRWFSLPLMQWGRAASKSGVAAPGNN